MTKSRQPAGLTENKESTHPYLQKCRELRGFSYYEALLVMQMDGKSYFFVTEINQSNVEGARAFDLRLYLEGELKRKLNLSYLPLFCTVIECPETGKLFVDAEWLAAHPMNFQFLEDFLQENRDSYIDTKEFAAEIQSRAKENIEAIREPVHQMVNKVTAGNNAAQLSEIMEILIRSGYDSAETMDLMEKTLRDQFVALPTIVAAMQRARWQGAQLVRALEVILTQWTRPDRELVRQLSMARYTNTQIETMLVDTGWEKARINEALLKTADQPVDQETV